MATFDIRWQDGTESRITVENKCTHGDDAPCTCDREAINFMRNFRRFYRGDDKSLQMWVVFPFDIEKGDDTGDYSGESYMPVL